MKLTISTPKNNFLTLAVDGEELIDYNANTNLVSVFKSSYNLQLEEFYQYIKTLNSNEYIVDGTRIPTTDVVEFIKHCYNFRLNVYEKFDCKHCTIYINIDQQFFDKDKILIVFKDGGVINHSCNSITFFNDTPHYGTQYKINNIYFNITLQERLEILAYIRANKGTYEGIH
jgi:outer membrane lipoprotein-sorting protein